MDVLKIDLNPRIKTHRDEPRNVRRLWVELATHSENGSTVEGKLIAGPRRVEFEKDEPHYPWELCRFEPVPTAIEIYEDRLPAVLERVRTEAHAQIWKTACESTDQLVKEWIRNHRKAYDAKDEQERARFVYMKCNIRPEQQLVLFGYRRGIPPLAFCNVIDPRDVQKTVNARRFVELAPDKREGWYVDAPVTQQNAAQRANEQLATVLTEAFSKADERGMRRLEALIENLPGTDPKAKR